jgi:hypothetical protein
MEKRNKSPQLMERLTWLISGLCGAAFPALLSEACCAAQAGQNILPPRSKLHLPQSQLPHWLQVFTPFSSG